VQRFSNDKLAVFHLDGDAGWKPFPNDEPDSTVAVITLAKPG
jgi:hypothetical protein